MNFGELEFVLKILCALAAGSLIGLERSYHGRPAGFRTHALVCVASAVLMQLNDFNGAWVSSVPLEAIRTDPTRIAQGIMTGIGFLGAGLIFREGVTVRGLTTAASIWITAAIGIMYGAGIYDAAILATIIVLGILAVFRHIEDRMPGQIYYRQVIRFDAANVMPEAQFKSLLAEHGFDVRDLTYSLTDAGKIFEYRATAVTKNRDNIGPLVEHLTKSSPILEFTVSPTGD